MDVLERYYKAVDAGAISEVLALVANDLVIMFDTPDGRTRGVSRGDLAAHLAPVGEISIRHKLVETVASGDVQFALGRLAIDDVEVGTFNAVMWLTPDHERIARYHLQFVRD